MFFVKPHFFSATAQCLRITEGLLFWLVQQANERAECQGKKKMIRLDFAERYLVFRPQRSGADALRADCISGEFVTCDIAFCDYWCGNLSRNLAENSSRGAWEFVTLNIKRKWTRARQRPKATSARKDCRPQLFLCGAFIARGAASSGRVKKERKRARRCIGIAAHVG